MLDNMCSPLLDEPHAPPPQSALMDAAQTPTLGSTSAPTCSAIVDKLGGGNPKVCYINFKTEAHRAAHGRTHRATIEHVRTSAARTYDTSVEIRERWTRLFSMAQTRRRRNRRASQSQANTAVAPASSRGQCAVWADTLQESGGVVEGPVHWKALDEYRQALALRVEDLMRLSVDDDRVRVPEPVPRDLAIIADTFACGTVPRNVCRQRLAALGLSQRFEEARASLNKFVDSVDKSDIRGCRCAFALECTDDTGRAHQA